MLVNMVFKSYINILTIFIFLLLALIAVVGSTVRLRRDRRGVQRLTKLWPNGIVPFEFAYNVTWRDMQIVTQSFQQFHLFTCIRFIRRTNQNNYVRIYTNQLNLCQSTVGMVRRGGQAIILGKGCLKRGIILHEAMHTLGFFHEHQRPDRDHYVTIHSGNLTPGLTKLQKEYNFGIFNDAKLSGTPFDFNSIMMYGMKSFNRRGRRTISVVKNRLATVPKVIGQRDRLSEYDVMELHSVYGCNTCRNINGMRWCESMRRRGYCSYPNTQMSCRQTCAACGMSKNS